MEYPELQTWIKNVVCGLVSNPTDIELAEQIDEQGVLFTLYVNESDRGKVIGKEGTIANALRTLLRSAGRAYDIRASIKVDVPNSKFTPRD